MRLKASVRENHGAQLQASSNLFDTTYRGPKTGPPISVNDDANGSP